MDATNTDSRPRLIEVLMPVEQASILSPKEKNVRSGGYISTFHVWPARQPLAACRAALLATLLPDPGDATKREALLKLIGGEVKKTQKEKKDEDGNLLVDEITSVENGLLKWNVEDNEDMQGLREQIRQAAGGEAPRVFDPFAGGGAIPLEAMWLGCDVSASDLNPVAWLLLKGTLEYPQRYAGKRWPLPAFVNEWPDFIESMYGKKKRKTTEKHHFSDPRQMFLHETKGKQGGLSAFTLDADLSWHIRAWGRWVLERATSDLARYYPVLNEEPTVAYLWARTVRDIQTEGRIPILKTFMLARKKGKRIALLPVPENENKAVVFKLLTEKHLATPDKRRKVVRDNPHLEPWGVSEKNLEDFLSKGTKSDAGVWSPFQGGRPDMVALTMGEVRQQGKRGLMGIQMTAVCVQAPVAGKKKTEKKYRLPTAAEIELGSVPEEAIEEALAGVPYGIPDEATPAGGGKRASRAFSVQNYGIMRWRDSFTPRQFLTASIFVKHTREAIASLQHTDSENAEALGVYLTAVFGRFVDYASEQCRWEPKGAEVKSTMSGYKLPMVWDFAEANPLSERDRYYAGGIRAVSDAVSTFCRSAAPAARKPDVQCVSSKRMVLPQQDLCFTDPPYYDAIPYADLMNFFRIWQKRIIGDFNDDFREVFERPSPTWDADAEDGELIDDDSRHGGDVEKSRKAYENGTAKAFERSLAALKPNGRMVVVFANKEVDAWQSLIGALIRAGALKGFDDLRQDDEQSDLELDSVTQYYLLHREAFAFDPVLAGVVILYANAVGKTDRELQMAWNVIEQGGKKKPKRRKSAEDEDESGDEEPGEVLNAHAKADKYQLVPWQERTKDESLGESRPNHPAPLIDKLHRLMLLLKLNRADEVQSKYEEWGLAGDPTFPRVLQALREPANRDRQADERRLVESLASQLKMNRRVVVQDDRVREEPLFEYGAKTPGG